jgi:hypothetical protein
MKKNSNGYRKTSAAISIILLILTLAGLVWAAAEQNQKLKTACIEQAIMRTKVEKNVTDIVELKTDIKYIRNGIDDIKDEFKQ